VQAQDPRPSKDTLALWALTWLLSYIDAFKPADGPPPRDMTQFFRWSLNGSAGAVAHRLSTIAVMDRIVVMEAGRMVEDGSHQELLAQSGVYAGLWARQSGGFLPTAHTVASPGAA
jgi:hypothetical protein